MTYSEKTLILCAIATLGVWMITIVILMVQWRKEAIMHRQAWQSLFDNYRATLYRNAMLNRLQESSVSLDDTMPSRERFIADFIERFGYHPELGYHPEVTTLKKKPRPYFFVDEEDGDEDVHREREASTED